MAGPTNVQKKSKSNAAGNVTIASGDGWATPTAGNLIVAIVVAFDDVPVVNTAGFTLQDSVTLQSGAIRVYTKTATAGDTSINATTGISAIIQLYLYEDTHAAGVQVDRIAKTADTGGGVTSRSSGTTAAVTAADELCHAVVGMVNSFSGIGWTNSFATESPTLDLSRSASASRSPTGMTPGTTTLETTASWTTSRRAAGLIVTLKPGATTVSPPAAAATAAAPAPKRVRNKALKSTLETGTSGVDIATSDAASPDQFDVASKGTGATLAYDNAHAAHGSRAAKIATGGSSVQSYLGWTSQFGITAEHYGRVYLYLAAAPANAFYVVEVLSGGSHAFGIQVNTDGSISGIDGTGVFNTTGALPLNQWVRLEWHVIHSATVGQSEIKTFETADSTTPDGTMTSSANRNTRAFADEIRFGITQAAANIGPLWLDDLAAAALLYPGPSPTIVTVPPAIVTVSRVAPVVRVAVKPAAAGVTASASSPSKPTTVAAPAAAVSAQAAPPTPRLAARPAAAVSTAAAVPGHVAARVLLPAGAVAAGAAPGVPAISAHAVAAGVAANAGPPAARLRVHPPAGVVVASAEAPGLSVGAGVTIQPPVARVTAAAPAPTPVIRAAAGPAAAVAAALAPGSAVRVPTPPGAAAASASPAVVRLRLPSQPGKATAQADSPKAIVRVLSPRGRLSRRPCCYVLSQNPAASRSSRSSRRSSATSSGAWSVSTQALTTPRSTLLAPSVSSTGRVAPTASNARTIASVPRCSRSRLSNSVRVSHEIRTAPSAVAT